jgi:hypothetical protein
MATLPDTDRYSDVKLELICKQCGSAGLIPFEHLNRVLFCNGCLSLFRVEAGGLVAVEAPLEERISVQVRSSSSTWHHHQAIIEKGPNIAERLRDWTIALAAGKPARWTALCGVMVLVVGTLALSTQEPAAPPPTELPASLEKRAVLLAEALVRRNMEVLIGLTDPAQHRALRIWLAHGTDLPRQVSLEDLRIETEVLSKAKTTPGGDTIDVRVLLRVLPERKELVFDQRWVLQGEAWYFRPVRLRAQAQPISWPVNKQRQRAGR